jgi:autotransporter-associated beta strand protein
MRFPFAPSFHAPIKTPHKVCFGFLCRTLALFLFPAFVNPGKCADELIIHPTYPLASNTGAFGASSDYTVTINGQTAPVYSTTIKQLRWGGSGSLPTTTASFVPFDFSGSVTVTITAQVAITRLTIRPLSAGITPTISGNQATFTLTKAQALLIEINDPLAPNTTPTPSGTVAPPKPLFLFASPTQAAPVATTTFTPATFSGSSWPTTAGTFVFGPGLYTSASLQLYSGQRIHLLPGALLQTTIDSTDTDGVSITGTGIIDGSATGHKNDLLMDFNRCKNVTLNGPLLYNSPHWTVTLWNCQDVSISRIKVLNTHRVEGGNGDGTDICNSQGVTISDSFYYTTDDCISPKGATWFGNNNANLQNLENLTVTNCTLIAPIGFAVRIGDESRAPFMRNLTVRDCDIYVSGTAIGVQVVDSATVRDITFENLRIERYAGYPLTASIFKNEYSSDAAYGRIQNLLFKDISVLNRWGAGASKIFGNDATASVDGVTFENFRMTGTEIKTFTSGQLYGKTVTSMVTPANDYIYNLVYRTGRPLISVTSTGGSDLRTIGISSPSSGASIYYTTDGTEPSSTNGTLYNGTTFSISVSPAPIKLRAVAIASGLSPSIITETSLQSTTPFIFTGTGNTTYQWNSGGNWDVEVFPNIVGADVRVTSNFTDNTTLSLNQPITLGYLKLGDSQASSPGGNNFNTISILPGTGGSLRFETGDADALLERPDIGTGGTSYNNGVDQITANIQLDKTLEARIGNSNFSGGITLSGVVSGSGGIRRTFHTTGTPATASPNSSLRLTNPSNNYSGPTVITGGRVEVTGSVVSGANSPLGNATSAIVIGTASTTGINNNTAAELALLSTNATSNHTFSRNLDFAQGGGSTGWRSAFNFNSNAFDGVASTNTLALNGNITLGTRSTQITAQRRGMTIDLTGDVTGTGGQLFWNATGAGFSTTGGAQGGVIRLSNRARSYDNAQTLTNGTLVILGSVPATGASPIGTRTIGLVDGNGGNIASTNGQHGIRSVFLDNDGTTFARALSLGGGTASSTYNGGAFNVYNGYQFGGVNSSGKVIFSGAISSNNPLVGPNTNNQTITLGQNIALLAATGGTTEFSGVINDAPSPGLNTRVTINQFRNHPQLDTNTPGTTGTPDTGGPAGSNANDAIGTPTGGTVILSAANTYAGGTEVLGGTLLANNTSGSATGSGPVTVQSGARLGGTGTVSGNVSLAGGAGLSFALGTAPGAHDKLDLGGSLTFAGSNTLTIAASNSATATGTYTLITALGGTGSGALPTLSLPSGWVATLQRSANNLDLVVTATVPPAAPTGLTATAASDTQVNLAWTASATATSYTVKRSTVSGGPYATVTPSLATTIFNDTGRTAGTTYYYVVSASHSGGEGANSTEASATTWTPLQAWRVSNSLVLDGSGTSANSADPDGDGLINLLEYALNGAPTDATSAPLPTAALASSTLTFSFFRARSASELTYTVQASSDLAGWSDLVVNPGGDSAVGQNVTVTDEPPAGATRRFLRLKVQLP